MKTMSSTGLGKEHRKRGRLSELNEAYTSRRRRLQVIYYAAKPQ